MLFGDFLAKCTNTSLLYYRNTRIFGKLFTFMREYNIINITSNAGASPREFHGLLLGLIHTYNRNVCTGIAL